MSRTAATLVAASAAVILAPSIARAFRRCCLAEQRDPQVFHLACTCGKLRAVVRAPAPVHLVCHCHDCQAYAAWVSEQRPSTEPALRTVDASGGVRTVQAFKGDIELTSGAASLLQVSRLDPGLVPPGRPFPLLRLHATCCGTPMFNTWRELATCSFFASTATAEESAAASALHRPPRWRLNTRWARGENETPKGSPEFSPLFLLQFVVRNLVYRRRAAPCPFALPDLDKVIIRLRPEKGSA